ncbi:putative wiskott-Aldrich syndrome protein-like 1 isoform X2 [Apostichopus japonicus]|uniref:Putative wiskott-Aldrich syndrome protein-like 1 isoform X2 n=1 Tax=Stichopus japonicus TaxID=307972 RepID=A0A2G8LMB6_STIJA|nr:putative wiskott-Aldrich syndrome protein-like 1 isoform X2 [Apostichopus japonicus]
MRLRRKGSGSNLSDTEESLSDSIDSPNRKASKNRNFVPAPWNCCRVALSRRAGRFEMPMDMRDLVGMRPAEYLMKHCKVNPQRIALYRRTFSKVDKDCDGRINRKELNQAVTEALVDTVNEDQVASVLKSIGVGEDKSSMVKFSFFAPFCALLERLHYSMFVS